MDLSQIELFVSFIAAVVPLALTILSGIFGIRTVQQRDQASPTLTLTQFERRPELPPVQRRRLQYQRLETVLGLLIVPLTIWYNLSLLATLPGSESWRGRLAYWLLAIFYLASSAYYAALLVAYSRMARTVFRTAPRPAGPCAQATLTVDAARLPVAQICQRALRQLRTTLQRVDLDAGMLVARRHYLYNLYPVYFDEITIRIEQVGADRYRLHLQSSGAMPSVRSDGVRNRHNLDQLLSYLTA